MKYCIDMDGVICDEMPTFERALAKPHLDFIETMQKLKKAGNFITIYTSRGWVEYKMTKDWLDKYEVPYDVLLLGKPIYDVWIDDRAVNIKDLEIL